MTDSTFVIAEAGVNHNGSLERALELVEVAAKCGADAVKFQTFRAALLLSRDAPKAAYQTQNTGSAESQYEMIARLELDADAHRALLEKCRNSGVLFLSTPFDLSSVQMLVDFDVPMLKMGSGEITNAPLLLAAAQSGKPVLLSTGMCDLGDIESALGVLAFGYLGCDSPSITEFERAYFSREGQKILRENVTLLHCTTEYPAPFGEVNLRAMKTLRAAFGLPVGFSDHTPGFAIAIAAVARGARVIEKHFTLDRDLPGPDHRASLEPDELAAMIQSIRQVEAALGDGRKIASPGEFPNRAIARKSLVAARNIRRGEAFSLENLAAKRPGTGISALRLWEFAGKTATRDYAPDEQIES